MPAEIDALDARLLLALEATPRAGVMELARQLEVARGTVQARLEKLQSRGVIMGFGPQVDVRRLGYSVLAFVTLEIAQGRLHDVSTHLASIPEVLEVHSTTGGGDLLCRVVAPQNEDLQDVIARMLEVPGIERTTTQIALTEPVSFRTTDLVARFDVED